MKESVIPLVKTTTKSMTSGSILKLVVLFALLLMLGNLFQMFYNTVDSIIVGRYVGAQALAAVGSTTMLSNMAIFFFNGFATGAGVIVSRAFGAKDMKQLHVAIETTMAATFLLSLFFSFPVFWRFGPFFASWQRRRMCLKRPPPICVFISAVFPVCSFIIWEPVFSVPSVTAQDRCTF